jgi:glycerophosphoryl diester phosphodiesterase
MDLLWSTFEARGCLNIAHRGARSLAPENTLAAAEAGRLAGADGWELDVGLTRDGALVVVHDATLERTSDARTRFPDRAPWRVMDFTLAELKGLDFGAWFLAADPFGQVAAGRVANPETLRGLAIPTLAEALEFTRDQGWTVNVELKDLDSDPQGLTFPAQAVRLIQELDLVDRVLVSSFNHGYLVQVRKIDRKSVV